MTNPSIEYMRRIRREEQAKLLRLRRERVVKALKSLDLHGGSHAMLSQIAYAVHPHVGAWDAESCDHLRNVLAELIGEARDEAASGAEHRCSCGAGGCHRGHEQTEVSGQSRTCPESDGDVSESDDGTSITSELREWAKECTVQDMVLTTYPEQHVVHGILERLIAIADRIDGQFARICEQHEVVLQQTISDVAGVKRGMGGDLLMPVDVFLRVRDSLRHDVEMWRDRAEDMRMERDELLAITDRIEEQYARDQRRGA